MLSLIYFFCHIIVILAIAFLNCYVDPPIPKIPQPPKGQRPPTYDTTWVYR